MIDLVACKKKKGFHLHKKNPCFTLLLSHAQKLLKIHKLFVIQTVCNVPSSLALFSMYNKQTKKNTKKVKD